MNMLADGEKQIRLSGRPPVIINTAEWPIIASAQGNSWKGDDDDKAALERAREAGRVDTYSLAVRRNAEDGRCLVYGAVVPGEANRNAQFWFGGELLGFKNAGPTGVEIAETLEKVGRQGRIPGEITRKVIGQLPAERI